MWDIWKAFVENIVNAECQIFLAKNEKKLPKFKSFPYFSIIDNYLQKFHLNSLLLLSSLKKTKFFNFVIYNVFHEYFSLTTFKFVYSITYAPYTICLHSKKFEVS